MLSVIGNIYGKVANLRNSLYDRGVFESYELGARTISIGNITTGGTGKTPLAAYVASILAERGETVCILTRGYGRINPSTRVVVSDFKQLLATPLKSGDEPFELAQKLLGKAVVIADADRVAAAEWAIRKFGVTAFVLDDGFQHRRARRDLDIVCIDATNPFGGRQMLPAGRLREPLEGLKRADAVVITRTDQVDAGSDLRFAVLSLVPNLPLFTAKTKISRVTTLGAGSSSASNHSNWELTKDKAALAFCGLGNPENFYSLLRQEHFSVSRTKTFVDHHRYSQDDINAIEKQARDSEAEVLLTTSKDSAKLLQLEFRIPCFVVEIETEICEADAFAEML